MTKEEKSSPLTRVQVRERFKARYGSLAEFIRESGFSRGFVHDVLAGRRKSARAMAMMCDFLSRQEANAA